MKRFSLMLSRDHRETLDDLRAKWGLRSEADAVRHMIDHAEYVPGLNYEERVARQERENGK